MNSNFNNNMNQIYENKEESNQETLNNKFMIENNSNHLKTMNMNI